MRPLLLLMSFALVACVTPAPELVQVELTEFGIQSSTFVFEAGKPYLFEITNQGALNHEFTVMPIGATMDHSGQAMEHEGHAMGDVLLHVGEEQLSPGATVSVEFTFTRDAALSDLEFACHVPGHYEAGMAAPIEIGS